jgi:Uncharacterized conserved protein
MEPFKKNNLPTLGIEEELHLIDTETAELTPAVNEVMALLSSDFRERVCYELLQCVLETRTGVYETVDDLIEETAMEELSLRRAAKTQCRSCCCRQSPLFRLEKTAFCRQRTLSMGTR